MHHPLRVARAHRRIVQQRVLPQQEGAEGDGIVRPHRDRHRRRRSLLGLGWKQPQDGVVAQVQQVADEQVAGGIHLHDDASGRHAPAHPILHGPERRHLRAIQRDVHQCLPPLVDALALAVLGQDPPDVPVALHLEPVHPLERPREGIQPHLGALPRQGRTPQVVQHVVGLGQHEWLEVPAEDELGQLADGVLHLLRPPGRSHHPQLRGQPEATVQPPLEDQVPQTILGRHHHRAHRLGPHPGLLAQRDGVPQPSPGAIQLVVDALVDAAQPLHEVAEVLAHVGRHPQRRRTPGRAHRRGAGRLPPHEAVQRHQHPVRHAQLVRGHVQPAHQPQRQGHGPQQIHQGLDLDGLRGVVVREATSQPQLAPRPWLGVGAPDQRPVGSPRASGTSDPDSW